MGCHRKKPSKKRLKETLKLLRYAFIPLEKDDLPRIRQLKREARMIDDQEKLWLKEKQKKRR